MSKILLGLLILEMSLWAQTDPRKDRSLQANHVVVYYDTSGIHAPLWIADADGNGHPDYIDSIAGQGNQFWIDVVDKWGLHAPAFDSTVYAASPIYVADLYTALSSTDLGANQTEGYPNSRCYIENDFMYNNLTDTLRIWQPSWSSSIRQVSLYQEPYVFLKATLYHELMHGVQRNYGTNAEFGAWPERVTTWIENRVMYERQGLAHAIEFRLAQEYDFIRSSDVDAKYANNRFLTLLESLAGPAAVMEIFTERPAWIDSVGVGMVGNPTAELGYFQAILAQHNIDFTNFVARYAEEVARIWEHQGSIFPVEEEYFRYGQHPTAHLASSLTQVDSLGPLSSYIYEFSSPFTPGNIVTMTFTQGTGFVHFYAASLDTLWSVTPDSSGRVVFQIPSTGAFRMYVMGSVDGAHIQFTSGGTLWASQTPKAFQAQVSVSMDRLILQGLQDGKTYRVRAWDLQGREILTKSVIGGQAQDIERPLGEGPLVTKIELIGR